MFREQQELDKLRCEYMIARGKPHNKVHNKVKVKIAYLSNSVPMRF